MSTKRKAENLLFIDVSEDPKYPSKAWLYFNLEKNAGIAQCNDCDKLFEAKNGSVTGEMIKHLTTIHDIGNKWKTKNRNPVGN